MFRQVDTRVERIFVAIVKNKELQKITNIFFMVAHHILTKDLLTFKSEK